MPDDASRRPAVLALSGEIEMGRRKVSLLCVIMHNEDPGGGLGCAPAGTHERVMHSASSPPWPPTRTHKKDRTTGPADPTPTK